MTRVLQEYDKSINHDNLKAFRQPAPNRLHAYRNMLLI